MLTKRQYELLMLIDKRLKENGIPPSFEEMKEAVGLKSKSGIHRLITGLEERGFIRRLPNKARALEILHLPANAANAPHTAPVTAMPVANDETTEIPLYGKIAAGTPIEALRSDETIGVPTQMLGAGEHYALTVAGDSMIEAGILDGDTVIIKRCAAALDGDIVVALVDGTDVTLKRLRRKGKTIALEPANAAYPTRIFSADRVVVQGKLAGLMRSYS